MKHVTMKPASVKYRLFICIQYNKKHLGTSNLVAGITEEDDERRCHNAKFKRHLVGQVTYFTRDQNDRLLELTRLSDSFGNL